MDKEAQAITRLRIAYEQSRKLNGAPLYVTDSGGKDSAVICALAEKAGVPFEIAHSHTTADAPETVRLIRERAKEYEAKGIKYTIEYPTYKGSPVSMWSLIPIKLMPPTRLVRYCCDVLKEQHGTGRVVVTGVRWAESASRAKKRSVYEIQKSDTRNNIRYDDDNDDSRRLFESCNFSGKRVCNPIIDWSNREVWDYLAENNVKANPLYYNGFTRVGCIGCPMASKHRYEEFAMYPKYKDMYMSAFGRMLTRRKEMGKKTMWMDAEEVFHWWMEDSVMLGQISFDADMEEQ